MTHAPSHAAYYTWSRSTAEPPVIVFYDASGRELRKVTEDMEGRTVYRDTDYDRFGNVKKQWEPYYSFDPRQDSTEYKYDSYHRLDTVIYPDGTSETIRYVSEQGTSTVTTVFHATNGVERTTSKESNVLGWTTRSTDNSGATVFYYYYPDGKLKKAGLNQNMDVQMQYDDGGNRTDILDPDYGRQQNTYNAFGELVSTTTPKGDVIEYRLDALGRVVKRYDRDLTNSIVDSTIWVYGDTGREKGLLKSVNFNNARKAITYFYDTLCRPVTIGDSRPALSNQLWI